MNKKIETRKVNNGQELINKAKEYKNSGGEWKLLERYMDFPAGKEGSERDNNLTWGIVISNGNKKIDIHSAKNNISRKPNDEIEVRDELQQLFPETESALFKDGSTGRFRELEYNTFKLIKDANREYNLHRYLVAEDSWHLRQILNEYVRENEDKVYQSTNPHFSGWVEIIDGQDGNMYLYVGEKNDSGGREIKIGIKKEEFENCKRDEADSPHKALEDFWGLFTLGRPRTPAEEKKYYSSNGGLEEYWRTVDRFWEQACRTTLEALRGELIKSYEFWDNEPNEETRTREVRAVNQKISKINRRLEDMKENYPDWYNNYNKNCSNCGHRMCCDKEGHICRKTTEKYGSIHFGELAVNPSTSPKSNNNKNNQISDSEKSQLLQYFIAKGIKKITLDNGKLIIEYNDYTKKTVEENKDQQLQKYYQLIQTLPSQSLSLNELQNNNNSSALNKNNAGIYIGLVVGAFILGGTFVYFLARKKKK